MPSFEQVQEDRERGRREFRDWKKHYVRAHGWLPVFKVCQQQYGSVQYLTLCAKEAIDVRYFAQRGVLARNSEKNDYPSLTFIEADDEDYAFIAESLGKVRLSIRGTLEGALLNKSHASYYDLEKSFPYHVVNLDFCGHIVPPKDHPYSETIRCIERVMELQSQSDVPLWFLFLTFRAQEVHANQEANSQLEELVVENLKRDDFKASYGKRAAPDQLRQRLYPEFLRIGIGKLLADRARSRGLKVMVESSWLYQRGDGTYHIVKLVLRFERIQKAHDLPSAHRTNAAYEASVHEIFKSRPISVDGLGPVAKKQADQDLKGVIKELEQAGIIT